MLIFFVLIVVTIDICSGSRESFKNCPYEPVSAQQTKINIIFILTWVSDPTESLNPPEEQFQTAGIVL